MNRVVIKLNRDYDPKDVSEVLNSVFSEKSSFAEYKVEYYKKICEDFEKKYKLNSKNFIKNLIMERWVTKQSSLIGMRLKKDWISGPKN